MATEFNPISPTALLVAYARAFSGIPLAQEIAISFNCQAVVKDLLGCELVDLPEIAVLVENRYRCLNQVAAGFGYSQVIEIASGLLPRGMEQSVDESMVFIETDLAPMIAQKAELAKKLVGDRPNLHFLAVDITSSDQLTRCQPYLHQSPVLTLTEGLLMYLTSGQKQQAFRQVHQLLTSYGGVWLTTDLVTVEAINRRKKVCPNLAYISQMVSRLSDRPITDTYFRDDQTVAEFITSQGFRYERVPVLQLGVKLESPDRLNIQFNEALLRDAYVYILRVAKV